MNDIQALPSFDPIKPEITLYQFWQKISQFVSTQELSERATKLILAHRLFQEAFDVYMMNQNESVKSIIIQLKERFGSFPSKEKYEEEMISFSRKKGESIKAAMNRYENIVQKLYKYEKNNKQLIEISCKEMVKKIALPEAQERLERNEWIAKENGLPYTFKDRLREIAMEEDLINRRKTNLQINMAQYEERYPEEYFEYEGDYEFPPNYAYDEQMNSLQISDFQEENMYPEHHYEPEHPKNYSKAYETYFEDESEGDDDVFEQQDCEEPVEQVNVLDRTEFQEDVQYEMPDETLEQEFVESYPQDYETEQIGNPNFELETEANDVILGQQDNEHLEEQLNAIDLNSTNFLEQEVLCTTPEESHEIENTEIHPKIDEVEERRFSSLETDGQEENDVLEQQDNRELLEHFENTDESYQEQREQYFSCISDEPEIRPDDPRIMTIYSLIMDIYKHQKNEDTSSHKVNEDDITKDDQNKIIINALQMEKQNLPQSKKVDSAHTEELSKAEENPTSRQRNLVDDIHKLQTGDDLHPKDWDRPNATTNIILNALKRNQISPN